MKKIVLVVVVVSGISFSACTGNPVAPSALVKKPGIISSYVPTNEGQTPSGTQQSIVTVETGSGVAILPCPPACWR